MAYLRLLDHGDRVSRFQQGKSFSSTGIPAIAPSATNSEVTSGNDYYFRSSFLDSSGRYWQNWLMKSLRQKTVIFYEKGSEYSEGLATVFKKEFTELAGSSAGIIYEAGYESSETDFTSILEDIYDLKPDHICTGRLYTVRNAHKAGQKDRNKIAVPWRRHMGDS